MELTFLGSGSAFSIENYQSNMILEKNGKRLLIDCGGDVRHSLNSVMSLKAKDIDAVYISHPHSDHVGGLEWLGLCTYFDPSARKPVMYVNENLSHELWEESLKGGLGTIQGELATLDTFFDVQRIGKNECFTFEGIKFQIVQTVHVMNGYSIMPSYGLMWDGSDGKKVFLTTDTQFCPNQINTFYNIADLIFHDCETAPYFSGVHAHYNQLKELSDEIRGKMWLYHYQDGQLPNAEEDGFLGFVRGGQRFTL